MAHNAVIASWAAEESGVAKLAMYFPSATAVRVPVRVSRINEHAGNSQEETVIEYGTPTEVLFAVELPLEFGDRLRLQCDGLINAEAVVVAVMYHESKTAVAARFSGPVANWVIKK